jgi:hypothetical protein
MQVIVFKLSLVVIMAVLGERLCRSARLLTCSDARFGTLLLLVGLVPATAAFIAIYVIGHVEVPSDVPGYYVPAAQAVLSGKIPYRDFGLSYAPLFPYVGAAMLRVWNDGRVFIILDIILSALSPLLWYTAASEHCERATTRQAAVLYATSGHILLLTLLGTSQVWIATALGASTLLLVRSRSAWSGAVQALITCTTKVLALLFWPVLWICAPGRVRWTAASVPACLLLYGGFQLAGADILDPLRREGALYSSGNIPYLLGALLGEPERMRSPLVDALTASALLATLIWFYLQGRTLPAGRRTRLLVPGIALVGFVFMVASKKSFTGYAAFIMFPAILAITLAQTRGRARVATLLLLNALLALEPTLDYRYIEFGGPSTQAPGSPGFAAFLLMELLLVGFYIYLAYLSGIWIRAASSEPFTTMASIRAAVSSEDHRELTL